MKLPSFDYHAPKSLDEAVALLAASDGGARVLAGGQSLMPVMAFRLATPTALVDLRQIAGLDQIEIIGREIKIGAMVRWRMIEESRELKRTVPVLPAAMEHVAHYQIRNRGTIGGSLAHADPAAEFPALAVGCDAVIDVIGSKGARAIKAADLFTSALETSLKDDEIITAVRIPTWPKLRRWGFQEFARRRGDFAIAGVMAFFDLDAQGVASNTHISVFGATDIPRRLNKAEAALDGKRVDEAAIEAVASIAMSEVNPQSDLHATSDYRRSLVGTMTKRALAQAAK
jgi:carbon-monoxide dehydrogenase medium subunit